MRLGQTLLIHYHWSSLQSLYTILQPHHVTLYVPTKQSGKESRKQKERELKTKTEMDRFSYTTGQLCVRLAYWFTSPTDMTHSHQHSHTCMHSHSLTHTHRLPNTHTQKHTHTAAMSPAAHSPNSPHHSVDMTDYKTLDFFSNWSAVQSWLAGNWMDLGKIPRTSLIFTVHTL